jgi:hypothetical protein
MTTIDLDIRIIDDEVSDRLTQAGPDSKRLTIDSHTTFELDKYLSLEPSDNAFLVINQETLEAQSTFSAMRLGAIGSPIGRYELKNAYILGQPGIITDPRNRICWIGYSLGWNLQNLKDSVERNKLGKIIDDRVLRIDSEIIDNADRSEDACPESIQLLSAPGFGIFGHWLLDVAPRLYAQLHSRDSSECSIVCPPIPPWGQEFFEAFCNKHPVQKTLRNGRAFTCKNIEIVSNIKSNRVMDTQSAISTWSLLKDYYLTENREANNDVQNMYISRSKFTTHRKLANAPEVEQYFSSIGWAVVYPEQLSLREQANLFSRASFIVADDGSALHNSIYSNAGTKLLCLDFSRQNMLHASFSSVLEHKLAYLNCDEIVNEFGAMQWVMPVGRLREAINLMSSY